MISIKDKAKIILKEIKFQLNDNISSDLFVQSLDYVPLVYMSKINDPKSPPVQGTTIDPKDVIYIKLHNSMFVPEIELYCEDSKGVLFNDFYPFDHDTILSIFVKASSDITMPIRMDFRVAEYETVKSSSKSDKTYRYLIKGILDVDDLHFTRYESRKGTSYNVIRDMALQMNLGFASNVESSDDEMTWINPSDTYREFIKDITKYSFVSPTSFVWSFIDFYYNLNYVDVQLELNEFLKDEAQNMGNTQVVKDGSQTNTLLYLSNNQALQGTNQYFSKFNLVNQSFKVNLDIFYQMKSTWYDKSTNTVIKDFISELETDENKLGSKLVQLMDKKSQIYQENVNDEYFIGKIDTQKNVHKNYALAKVMNKYNLDGMEKMKLIITLDKINFSIKRFQNIRIELYDENVLFSREANEKKPLTNVNSNLSGFWYVTGINYLYKRTGGVEQEVILSRRDLSLDYGAGNDEKNDISSVVGNTNTKVGTNTK